ncbi:hypothetical protein [Nitrosomonas ureae]|uniref:Major capsid protein n=1 Tax=Nitrosomonas ureae TaxID=44577 RepID=A0A1H2ENG7_9PROT|nr:hypothetical protein [Nitrosomonas ureae]ALQ51914.1 hypothetical protein ATY38_12200 [Nitrosomonas ureae]SDT96655.1 hypothetical protein SAMN05216406_11428 [Nitrosomonas ureae]
MAITKVADLVKPEIFLPYVQQQTTVKSRLIQSGILVPDAQLDLVLLGGGNTFNEPSFRDLPDDDDNVSSDNEAVLATPSKVSTSKEIQVRLSRNKSWSSMDLAGDLAGADPMLSVVNRVADYKNRRLQGTFIAVVKGLLADNAASPTGTDTHTQNDMTVDISGSSYSDGVTNLSAEAVIDAKLTMGDSMDELGLISVHSIVYGRMQKNNLIDMIPDSQGVYNIPVFNGMVVIVDDSMPASSGVFESWLFGRGSFRFGQGLPKVPLESDRVAAAGNGAGMETLHHRWEWIIHPAGCAYVGTAPSGGPGNTAASNDLANAGSWSRVWPERKQVHIARLITREA